MDFISPAYAQSVAGGFDIMGLMPLVLIFGVMYFLLIRPQQKKMKEQKEMQTNLRRGDRILTTGGIIGVVAKVVSDEEVQVEIADGVKVRVARAMIATTLSKGEPVADEVAPAKAIKSKSKSSK